MKYDFAPFRLVLWSNLRHNLTVYIGKENDHENKLADHGVRKYDESIGRFTAVNQIDYKSNRVDIVYDM